MIRDRAEIEALGFPVFFRGTSPRGPGKNGPGALGVPVGVDGVPIHPGDLVCADADGVAIVSGPDVDDVKAAVAALEQREAEVVADLRRGKSTVDIVKLEDLP